LFSLLLPFFISYFVICAFRYWTRADVLDASFDPSLRDEVIFLWLPVVVDSWISDKYYKQQELIHKIPLSLHGRLRLCSSGRSAFARQF
jgi:hypothetical protein